MCPPSNEALAGGLAVLSCVSSSGPAGLRDGSPTPGADDHEEDSASACLGEAGGQVSSSLGGHPSVGTLRHRISGSGHVSMSGT